MCHSLENPTVRFVPVTVDEDSISDWSTDSCGWSEDDFDVDLDVTTPPLSVDSGALDTSDQEIVRCICEVEEENDFMIQVSLLLLLLFFNLNKALLFIAFECKTFTIVKYVCLVVSVKIVCAGSMAPVWDCWKKMFQTVTPATSAETHQVRGKNDFILFYFFKADLGLYFPVSTRDCADVCVTPHNCQHRIYISLTTMHVPQVADLKEIQ